MIDMARIVGFNWDDGNRLKSLSKHGVTQAEAEQVFASDQTLVLDDLSHSQTEAGYQALGKAFAGRLLHVTFTLRERDTLIRVISARHANRKERAQYEGQA
jgi:uncharacterized DUF497 family protein